MPNIIGRSFGRYQIIEKLGEGGMATVYKAYDKRLETEVAIKVIRVESIPPDFLGEVLTRFDREAKSLARLTHPNIVKVIDYGEFEFMPYLVMEYLPSGTLKSKIKGPIPYQKAARMLIPIAQALDFAHRQGIIHRDVKPANILVAADGAPMLTDFGIAKILNEDNTTDLTSSSVMVGTPEYMAPEQVSGKRVDHRADIYALGVVFYEMITGRRPFVADTPLAILYKHANEPLPHPQAFVPDLPPAVESVLFKALAKKPEDRYQDIGQFASALESLTANLALNLEDPSIVNPPRRNVAHRSTPKGIGTDLYWILGVIAGLLGILGVAGMLMLRNSIGLSNNSQVINPIPAVSIIPTETVTPIPSPTSWPDSITDPIGASMRFIPAGEFTMGTSAQDAQIECNRYNTQYCQASRFVNETPPHVVTLDAFYMDTYEVTNANYKLCVDAGVCKTPLNTSSATRSNYYGDPQFDNYPVLYVDWQMAKTYCEWRGGSLPTEAQWEKAARGTDTRPYPWGKGLRCNLANYNSQNNGPCTGDTTPVGSYAEGISPYGLYDMAGNVWEWTLDWHTESYDLSLPSANPTGAPTGVYRVLRGSSWFDYEFSARTTFRGRADPNMAENYIGFRCVRFP